MEQKHKYDWNRIATLLHVIGNTQGYPKLGDIHGAALEELQTLNDEPKLRDRPGEDRRKVVTPPGGPENSAYLNDDGTLSPRTVPNMPQVRDTAIQVGDEPKNPAAERAQRQLDLRQPSIESIRRNADGSVERRV